MGSSFVPRKERTHTLVNSTGFPGGSDLPAMQETWVQILGWEDPLEEEMAIHSSFLYLENFMDRGAWQPTVHRVTKSWT